MLNKTFVIAHNHDTKLKLSKAANLFNFKKSRNKPLTVRIKVRARCAIVLDPVLDFMTEHHQLQLNESTYYFWRKIKKLSNKNEFVYELFTFHQEYQLWRFRYHHAGIATVSLHVMLLQLYKYLFFNWKIYFTECGIGYFRSVIHPRLGVYRNLGWSLSRDVCLHSQGKYVIIKFSRYITS
jgi:hypothetical protein